jgi:hypothetical protein
VAFARSLGFEPDGWQADLLRSDARRILVNVHRQGGKGVTAAILALHQAIYRPKSLTLLVSPSQRQSSELFKKVQDWADALDRPLALEEDNALGMKLANGSRVVSLPGRDSTIRGFSGVDLVVEDEASRVDDSLYRAIRPMLATSGGRLVLMSTPFGKRGHFWQEWTERPHLWERFEVWAKACRRIPAEFLRAEEASLGRWFYAQEYECAFADTVDQLFAYELVRRAITAEVTPLFGDVA